LRLIKKIKKLSYNKKNDAKYKNPKSPITSVTVVRKTAEDNAGSTLSLLRPTGTKIPANPATSILHNIAVPNTKPSSIFQYYTRAIIPTKKN